MRLLFNKPTIVLPLMLVISFQINCASQKALFSPFTQHLLKQLEIEAKNQAKTSTPSDKIQKDFLIKIENGVYVIHGNIVVELTFKESHLKPLKIKVNTKLDQLWTVVIPLTSLEPLGSIKGVNYIEIDVPIKKK